jgi:uncharacterized YigZ family protein
MGFETAARQAETETVIRRSRFIGFCAPVADEAEALALIASRKKQHWDATHNCHAYVTGENAQTTRSNDDGEPHGTAGIPILEAIRAKGLTRTLVVVTRYFGGVLLGAGGLARAYSGSAAAALDAAGRLSYEMMETYRIRAGYPDWHRMERYAKAGTFTFEDTVFGEDVEALLVIPADRRDETLKALAEGTDGRVRPVPEGERYAAREK